MGRYFGPDEPPDPTYEDPRNTLTRVLVETSRRYADMPYQHVMQQATRTLCMSAEVHRPGVWGMYEFYEERTMVYLQVCTTDQREMACDNRHMRIQP